MSTDKTQYVREEMVKLKVISNLDIPIWYIGYPHATWSSGSLKELRAMVGGMDFFCQ